MVTTWSSRDITNMWSRDPAYNIFSFPCFPYQWLQRVAGLGYKHDPKHLYGGLLACQTDGLGSPYNLEYIGSLSVTS